MSWNVDHLFWLRHDPQRFEAARLEVIENYISSLPVEAQPAAREFQARVDEARARLGQDEFLKWMQEEAAALSEELSSKFTAAATKLTELKQELER